VRAIVLEPKFIDLDEPAPVLVMPAKGTNILSGTNRDISIWSGQHEEKAFHLRFVEVRHQTPLDSIGVIT
jgi:hypothetical protein